LKSKIRGLLIGASLLFILSLLVVISDTVDFVFRVYSERHTIQTLVADHASEAAWMVWFS